MQLLYRRVFEEFSESLLPWEVSLRRLECVPADVYVGAERVAREDVFFSRESRHRARKYHSASRIFLLTSYLENFEKFNHIRQRNDIVM